MSIFDPSPPYYIPTYYGHRTNKLMDSHENITNQQIIEKLDELIQLQKEQITDLIGVSEEQAALLHSINDTLRRISDKLRA